MNIESYPKVLTAGHRLIQDLLVGAVCIEEKIDGSQFSMMRTTEGELLCRSKGKAIVLDAAEKMFTAAIETAQSLPLKPGLLYRCEYLQKPKHNVLSYARVPNKHLIVFDVMTGPGSYMTPGDKRMEAADIGLECVPTYHYGVAHWAELPSFMGRESVLGGVIAEGIVIKNYSKFTEDGKVMVGKLVTDSFKEVHRGEWRKANPTDGDITESLINAFRTEARWNKAIQHLREDGKITDTPTDIGPLIKLIQGDVLEEEKEYIRETLFAHFWPKIQRGIIRGFPEHYKALVCRDRSGE